MNHQAQLDAIADHLASINAILAGLKGEATPAIEANDPWASPNVPHGYDTILGYFSKNLPSAFDLMDDPAYQTQHDGFWCSHQAKKRGLNVHKVEAPQGLADMGITEVNAYPVSLLRERMGS